LQLQILPIAGVSIKFTRSREVPHRSNSGNSNSNSSNIAGTAATLLPRQQHICSPAAPQSSSEVTLRKKDEKINKYEGAVRQVQ